MWIPRILDKNQMFFKYVEYEEEFVKKNAQVKLADTEWSQSWEVIT